MIRLSQFVRNITPSATEETSFLANQLRRRGIDILSFAQGEPDFETPDRIKDAGKKAIDQGYTCYTDVPGIHDLRIAVAEKFRRENNIDYDPAEVMISAGAKHALYVLFRSVLDPGDDVLIATPCYVSYAEQIKLAGGNPCYFKTRPEQNFRPLCRDIELALRPNTKALVLNSPNNPTGAVVQKDELHKIADLAVEKNFLVITDEVYEHLRYDDNQHISIASLNEDIKARTVTINSTSKTYAMTGWRVGYAGGPREIIDAMSELQGHASGNVAELCQWAAITALQIDKAVIDNMVATYGRRRDLMVDRINAIDGLQCRKPDGAFYVFADIKNLLGRKWEKGILQNDFDVVQLFLKKAHVAIIPGTAFNYPNYVRFVFAKSEKDINQGFDRIAEAVSRL
jgi:aspartate aminotransferase